MKPLYVAMCVALFSFVCGAYIGTAGQNSAMKRKFQALADDAEINRNNSFTKCMLTSWAAEGYMNPAWKDGRVWKLVGPEE